MDGGLRRDDRVRRAALLLLGVLACLLAGVGTAGPAAAHATLVTTTPAESARLDSVPAEVTLEFSEGVSLGAGYARVLDADGARADSDAASVDGRVLTIPLRGDLPDDGYLVTYRVISADSHPIAGAFSFVVGDGELVPVGTAGAEDPTDPLVAAALPVTRWIGFAGLALAIGVPVFVLLCWPAGWASDRLRRLSTSGTAAVAGAAAANFLLQGPYAAATGIGSALDPGLLAATAASGAGWSLLARVALAVALGAVLLPVWRGATPPSPGRTALAGVLALGLVVATAALGHAVAGPWPGLALTATAVHVAAMTVWLGGLVGLLAGLLRADPTEADLAGAMPRFSRLAFSAVVALVVTGAVQSLREVGSPTALVSTTYGWVLLAKLALVLALLSAAGVSRVWVQQRLGVRSSRPAPRRRVPAHAFAAPSAGLAEEDDHDTVPAPHGPLRSGTAVAHVPALRRSILVEAAVGVAVLALSAVLVGTPPARASIAQPVDVLLPLQGTAGPSGSVQVTVDPARPGANTLHVYLLDDGGRPTQPAEISVSLTEASQGIGPLDVDLQPAGPGHYVGDGMSIPGAGTWTLDVTLRLDEFTATTARTDLPVR